MDRYRGPSRRNSPPPPRDRPPLRDRDNHPDVEYFGQGESYRPGGSTGEGPFRPNRDRAPAADSWNSDRRDDRRREEIDSYIPPTSARASKPRSRSPGPFRRRSRSPPGRGKELFPDRTRSPAPPHPPHPPPPPQPQRRYSPRRDERTRSPNRRRSRSPGYNRPRSPDVKRPRDHSPEGRRSPKRERLSSPPRGRYERPRSPPRRGFSPREPDRNSYRPRSRTPQRGGGRPIYSDDNWRPRSPSQRASGPASNNTSRRSSPRPHPERGSLPASVPRSPNFQPRGRDSKPESLSYRPRSPPRHPDRSREPSPPIPERDTPAPPTGPASQRNGSDRPPPSGPSRGFNPSSASTPTGPASQMSLSSHGRGPTVFNAPTQPRGAPPAVGRFGGPPSRDFVNPALRGRSSLTYRAPGLRAPSYSDVSAPTGPSAASPTAPPSGPRAGGYSAPRGDYVASRGGYAGYGRGDNTYSPSFRASSNVTSATYPQTRRFNSTPTNTAQTYMNTLEKIVPGGKKLPSGLPVEQERRLKTLENESERIREDVKEKQRLKRQALTEWENRQRESDRDTLRSELAERALIKLQDEEIMVGGATF